VRPGGSDTGETNRPAAVAQCGRRWTLTREDRKQLEASGLSPEVNARTEEVLRTWEVEALLLPCYRCGKPCISPEVQLRQYRHKKPPSELFQRFPLGFRDDDGDIFCAPCDDARWQ
jgi:hypothetical protein